MKNKLITCFVFTLLVFILLPSSFALNNETIVNDVDNNDFTLNEANYNDIPISGNDYYFNADVEDEGNGSESNPYKYLTSDKLDENSVIHLNDGIYELNKGKTIYNISIIGENAENTIIKFQNNNSILTAMGNITLQNLTLMDVTIINYGNLNATNVIFKNSVAYAKNTESTNIVNSAANAFGGAIYCPSYQNLDANVYLDNCTFLNNTAEYGGAIYMCGGNLQVKNSIFLDNFAYNFGGAIASEQNAKLNIEKSAFINSKSLNDAGGAIYIKNSKLTVDSVNISNSKSTFGSAITSLDSTLTLNKVNAVNNTANYEGGAIYQMYGSFTLRNSNFINNSAKNGGALFLDNTTSVILYQNTYTNNSASNCAGAVYSLLNSKTRINFEEYYNNTANFVNDFYKTDSINILIGNGNYSMYRYNSTDISQLPENYSSLENGFVTSVKDQQGGGNCWAFAGIAVLESCILKASGDNLNLSEENMKNLMSLYSDYGWGMDTNQGGYPSMIMGYLLSWLGPVLEEEDLHDDYSTLSPVLDSIVHVQNVKYIKRFSYTDNNEIKEAIMKYGAVGTGIYFDYAYYNEKTHSYYSSITTLTNHAVTIVGWDDNYSRKNFINRPKANGAFLVKNSWNTDWGDEGYFYVSYYDTSFAAIGDSEASYTFILNDTVKFDKNYQYDIVGKTDYLLTGSSSVWYQNIFESTDNEYLAAVSTYFEKTCQWDLSIYVNDVLKLVKNGTGECGYYTIDLDNYVALQPGDIFKVIFKITADEASFPISEKITSNKMLYKPGVSFFSTDGKKWTDLFDYVSVYSSHTYTSQVACIKAFTYFDEIASDITLNITNNGYNPVNLVAGVVNQFGSPVNGGNVTFKINGNEYVVPVTGGIANLTVDLEEMATSVIDATFNAVGYLPCNTSACETIVKKIAKLDMNVTQHSTKTTVNVFISKMINETLIISVNDFNYTVDSIDGVATLTLDNLISGIYSIKASILNDTYFNATVSKEVKRDIKATKILASDFTAYYHGGNVYAISLIDEEGNNVAGREIVFKIDGNTFKNVTDENGTALLSISLNNGVYDLIISFDGDENHVNSSSSVNVTVNTTITSPDANYTLNSYYSLMFKDKDGNPLNNTNVSIKFNNVPYNKTTDEYGAVLLKVDFNPGVYLIESVNPNTGEKFEDNITVLPRIIGNKGFTMYFSSGSSYKVRLRDDYGNFVGENEILIVKIANKNHIVKTNKDGYASFKIKLNPNKYTITAEYKGYKVSNKITVKPILTAKNISKKKAKKIKFQAKLLTTKGKVNAGKKITFKIKGKTYIAKTNKKGIATVYLKNLKVGKHYIVVKYASSSIKKVVKIRK